MPNVRFAYDPEVAARFPSVAGGVVHAEGVSNGPSPAGLIAAFEAEQQKALARIGDTPLSELPTLAAWRRAFRAFGVDPTAYRSAAEALLRRLTKQGSIPSINALVDIGNLVAIRYGLPVAMFDQRSVTGGTTVRFAAGTESFTDLGSGDRETPAEGEVIFIDDAGLVSARRWCWRQSAESASGPGHDRGARHRGRTPRRRRGGRHGRGGGSRGRCCAAYAEPEAMASGVVTAQSPGFERTPLQSGRP